MQGLLEKGIPPVAQAITTSESENSMGSGGPFGLPAPRDGVPDDRGPDHGVIWLGALTMHITVFLSLMGQGYPAREALTVTIALGIGAAEIGRRRPGGRDDDDLGNPRWAR